MQHSDVLMKKNPTKKIVPVKALFHFILITFEFKYVLLVYYYANMAFKKLL